MSNERDSSSSSDIQQVLCGMQPAFTDTLAKMTSQDYGIHKQFHQNLVVGRSIYNNRNCGSNRDNCRGDIIHREPIGKHVSFHARHNDYRRHQRIATFNSYFCKEDFLDWLPDIDDFFDYMNIPDKKKNTIKLFKLS